MQNGGTDNVIMPTLCKNWAKISLMWALQLHWQVPYTTHTLAQFNCEKGLAVNHDISLTSSWKNKRYENSAATVL